MTVLAVLGRAEAGLVNAVLGHLAVELGVEGLAVIEENPEVETWARGRGLTFFGAYDEPGEDLVFVAMPGAEEPAAMAHATGHLTLVVKTLPFTCSPPLYTLEAP